MAPEKLKADSEHCEPVTAATGGGQSEIPESMKNFLA